MPGVHDGAPVVMLHDPPTVPPVDEQSAPLQHSGGRGDACVVHIRPGWHPPSESHRQPCVPTMHVVGAPEAAPGSASALPLPLPASSPLLWSPPQAARNATSTSVRMGVQSMVHENSLKKLSLFVLN